MSNEYGAWSTEAINSHSSTRTMKRNRFSGSLPRGPVLVCDASFIWYDTEPSRLVFRKWHLRSEYWWHNQVHATQGMCCTWRKHGNFWGGVWLWKSCLVCFGQSSEFCIFQRLRYMWPVSKRFYINWIKSIISLKTTNENSNLRVVVKSLSNPIRNSERMGNARVISYRRGFPLFCYGTDVRSIVLQVLTHLNSANTLKNPRVFASLQHTDKQSHVLI